MVIQLSSLMQTEATTVSHGEASRCSATLRLIVLLHLCEDLTCFVLFSSSYFKQLYWHGQFILISSFCPRHSFYLGIPMNAPLTNKAGSRELLDSYEGG